MSADKDRYRSWNQTQADIPVFSRDWWLDAVCGEDNWDVILVEQGNAIVASLPYFRKRRGPFSLITMPRMTQTLGPYLVYEKDLSPSDKLSYEKKTMGALIRRLPQADHIVITCSHRVTNWLPFYWAGFRQTTGYTYVIPDLSDLDRVFANFDYAKKKDIKKAQRAVEVRFDLSADAFYDNHRMTLAKQNSRIFYTKKLFRRIHDAAYAHNAGRTIYARDEQGRLHAALFIVWSTEGAYDLISTIDPDLRNSGAASLLVQQVIAHVSAFTRRFDFEGSMNEGVEASFRKFGAVQTPLMTVSKTPSRLLRLREALASVLKGDRRP